jgi:hypothetical protein
MTTEPSLERSAATSGASRWKIEFGKSKLEN